MAFEFFLADTLQRWGFWDFILPFVLVFTIVFAILQKTHILGSTHDAKKYNVAVAMVVGFAVVIPHALGMYPPGKDIVDIFNQALPNVSAVLVAIVMALLIIGVFGAKLELGGNSISGWIAALSFVIIIFIFGNAAGWWTLPQWLYWLVADGDTQALVITILVFAIIIYFITKDSTHKRSTKWSDKVAGIVVPVGGKSVVAKVPAAGGANQPGGSG